MARALRITFPGAFYHVTSRGNERKAVFKSISDRDKFLDMDEYAKELSRYIHLNPARAKIVETPAEYDGSSYQFYIGNIPAKSQRKSFAARHWGIWSITVLQACCTKDRKR